MLQTPVSSCSSDALSLEGLLLLCISDHLLTLHEQSLPLSDLIHQSLRPILTISQFSKIFQLFLCIGDPERILVQDFEACKDKLGRSAARCAFENFFNKAEGGVKWKSGGDEVES